MTIVIVNKALTPVYVPTRFRRGVWIPVAAVAALLLAAGPTIANAVVVFALVALVAYYEHRTRIRGIWETEHEVVIRNTSSTHTVGKGEASLWLNGGGNYGWFGWYSADRPTLDNAPAGLRLYVQPGDDDSKRFLVEAGLGKTRPELLKLGTELQRALSLPVDV